MDFIELKNRVFATIKNFFENSSFKEKFKDALKLPYAKSYIAFAIFMTFIFIVLTFPYDMLIRNQIKKLEKSVFKNIYISGIDSSLFRMTSLENCYMVLRSGNEITIKKADIDIALNPITLLLKKDIRGSIELNKLQYNTESSKFISDLNGNIYLDFLNFSHFPRKGKIKILLQNTRLTLDEITLPDSMGGLPLKIAPIRIKSMILECTLNGKRVNLTNVRIAGKDLRGVVTGSIAIGRMFTNSRLNLKIDIDPDSAVLKDYRDLLTKFIDSNNVLSIPLKGTIAHPRLDLARFAPSPQMNNPGINQPHPPAPPIGGAHGIDKKRDIQR